MTASYIKTPEISFTQNEDGHWEGTVECWQLRDYVYENIPARGDTFSTLWGTSTPAEPWADVPLKRIDVEQSGDAKRSILTLHYSNVPEPSGPAADDRADPEDDLATGVSEFMMSVSNMEVDIRRHPNYHTNWDHDLIMREDYDYGTEGLPDWWATASNTEDETEQLKWSKAGETHSDNQGFEWEILKSRQKPGVEAYILAGPKIVELRYFTDSSSAGTWAGADIGVIHDPSEKFGITQGEFLQNGESSVDPDGKRWEARRTFVWASSWDDDIYGTQ